ncbi:chain length determinant protein [Methylobacter sp. S3L5C]|uniref:GumC family protein n=1 Tax=Methylobacter sp. S3L5C TaxID=2839024 RepID=UPI001FAD1AF1|nr:chain length determinant protein [Methylobacter sp. S3L5C]UOA09132.1 chain length determinant protein [Methylobacter sp. S3L5C]
MTKSSLSSKADESVTTGAVMPWVSLRKHFRISLYVFITIVIFGIPFAWFKGKPYYSSTAVIYVAPRVANILQENKEQELASYQQYKQFIDQQTSTITRYDILLSALKKMGDKRFVWQLPSETDRRAAERLQAALIILPVKDTYSISVTLESDKPEGLADIVNTTVETYIEKVHEGQSIYASKERVSVLYEQRDKFQNVITERKNRLAALAQELSVTTFVDGVANPYDKLLANTQLAYSEAQRSSMAAEAGLLLFENPTDPKKASIALDAVVADIVYKDQGLFSLKANMYERRSELVQQISGLDPSHPGYALIKKQLEVIEFEVVEATDQVTKDVKHMLVEERRSKVTLTRKIEQDLLDQMTAQKKNAAWFSTYYNEALTLNQDIKRYYNQLESVENRIGFLELESKAPGAIRMDSMARPPEIPTRGGRKKILFIALIAGLLAALGVPIIIDMLDRRIRTVGQAEKILGYKPLAAFLDAGQDDRSLRVIADQRRRLALALLREHKQHGKPSSLILMTSVNHNSEVTSQAMDLAMDYKNIDMRAVVVEVNPLKPDQRYVSTHTAGGLLSLIIDPNLAISEVVSPANDSYPDRISIGLSTKDLLFGYQRLQIALEKIAEIYPLVILDAAPILFSADVEFFTNISDITLLLIAAKKAKPGEIKRAVQLLERIDPKVMGFVVTGLEIFHGGGYYSSIAGGNSQSQQAEANFFGRYFRKNNDH